MDDHRTEAACLLETGALYRTRIGLEPSGGDGPLVFAGVKPGAFSLYFGDEPIYHFDLEGRWQRAYIDGIHYLKGLDAEIHAIDRVREGPNLVLHRRKLGFGESTDLDARLRSVALDLIAALGNGRFRQLGPPDGKASPLGVEELVDFLETIARWDARRLVCPPRAIHRDLWPTALAPAGMPERGGHPGDARPRRGARRSACRPRPSPTSAMRRNSPSTSARSPRSGAVASRKAASSSSPATTCSGSQWGKSRLTSMPSTRPFRSAGPATTARRHFRASTRSSTISLAIRIGFKTGSGSPSMG